MDFDEILRYTAKANAKMLHNNFLEGNTSNGAVEASKTWHWHQASLIFIFYYYVGHHQLIA